MTTSDTTSTREGPDQLQESAELRQLAGWAEDIVVAMINLIDGNRARHDALPATPRQQWDVAGEMIMRFADVDAEDDERGRRLAHVMKLYALAQAPEVVSAAVLDLCRQLVHADPFLSALFRFVILPGETEEHTAPA